MTNLNPDPWLPPAPCPLKWDGVDTVVYRVSGTVGSLTYLALPNVECVSIQRQEGPDPGIAVYRYDFGSTAPGAPQNAVEALSTSFTGPLVVEEGDRLAVQVTRLDGLKVWWFDGRVWTFNMTLENTGESVTMTSTGIAKHLSDITIPGELCRGNSAPETVSDVPTDRHARFNVDGRPNASPSSADAGTDPNKYPTFLDPDIPTVNDSLGVPYPRSFDLPMACAYLLGVSNGKTPAPYVKNPTRTTLNTLLVGREPNGLVDFDPTNDLSYTAKPITAADIPLNGKDLPNTIHELIRNHGFGYRYDLADDGSGNPQTSLVLFLKQGGPVKSLYLQARGSQLDPGSTNVAGCEAGRETADAVNQIVVEGRLNRCEASFVLSPGFPSEPGDASGNMSRFDTTDAAFATDADYNTYRLWVLDESGEGHYLNASTVKVTTPTSLDLVFGAPEGTPPVAQYVGRRRPPIGKLITLDPRGQPLPWRLSISTDYAGAYPAVWDRTGTWRDITGSGRLLDDRVGFRIGQENPNKWEVGDSALPGAAFAKGIVKCVESIGVGTGVNKPFFLRATVVLEADQCMEGLAEKADSSPIAQVVERRVDARDKYAKDLICISSECNGPPFKDASGAVLVAGTPILPRDDREFAKAEAIALRTSYECGVFSGEFMVPYLTDFYPIGTRIDQIIGRGLSFRTDTGIGTSPVLPMIVGWRADMRKQKMYYTLSDAGLQRRGGKSARSLRARVAKPLKKRLGPARLIPGGAAAGGAVGGGIAGGMGLRS